MGCGQAFLNCLRFLFCRSDSAAADFEHEELLGRESNNWQADLGDGDNNSEPQQTVVVMRHGQRVDEVDESWAENAERPWDPPMTDLGCEQVASAAVDLRQYKINYVITSPFLRCLQTSAQVLKQLGLSLDSLVVDCQICEVCSPRTLNFGGGVYPTGHPEGWMWNGESLETALRSYIQSDPSFKQLGGQPVVLDTHMPPSMETIDDAMWRYSHAIQRISDSHPKSNILLVSHGEAVRESVNRVIPSTTVYEVQHAGFTAARRTLLNQEKLNLWSRRRHGQAPSQWKLLTESGTTGVSWM